MAGRYRDVLLVLIAIIAGFQAGYIYLQPATVVDNSSSENATFNQSEITIEINKTPAQAYHKIFENRKNSVVYISALKDSENGKRSLSSGSGFIYDKEGHIVTNSHVVNKGSEYEVTLLNGNRYNAGVVGRDPYTDLAVLKIYAGRELDPVKLGNSSSLKVGNSVLAIGNPFGLRGSMTAGIVSQKNRLLPSTEGFSIPNVIQTDAAINPGNSGGPLINLKGEVVGVNTAIDTRDNTFSGVGFAIPSSIIKRVVPVLIEKGEYRHPWIGVSGMDVTPPIADRMGLEEARGFLVAEVVEGSPAHKAGIQAGSQETNIRGRDVTLGGDVIVAIGGEPVRKINDILNYLGRETEVGDTITLTVVRDGKRKKIDLKLADRPAVN
ncbi:MAG: trypsin-like peptidase domain-containing protein [Candidatus Nanohaloarchaea archaeon]|nr:trypsin-like peptidase domain-containing protein [Candidatus Nanohaloarchaea archaeon]